MKINGQVIELWTKAATYVIVNYVLGTHTSQACSRIRDVPQHIILTIDLQLG